MHTFVSSDSPSKKIGCRTAHMGIQGYVMYKGYPLHHCSEEQKIGDMPAVHH